DLPVSNMREFADYVKANGSKMQFASAGVGTANHLVCYQITRAIGTNVTHISYRGSAEAMTDMLAGHLDFYCILAISGYPFIKARTIEAVRRADARALADPAGPAHREGTGLRLRRFLLLDGPVLPEEHAGADRHQVQRGAGRGARPPRAAGAAARGGHDRGAAGAPLARVPARLSRQRDQDLGRGNQGEWDRAAVASAVFRWI